MVIIPASFAADDTVTSIDDNLMIDDSIDDVLISDSADSDLIAGEGEDIPEEEPKMEIYFDSSALDDNGNGSIDNPYKTFSKDRIMENSILHFASGIYNYTPYSTNMFNVSIYGQDSSIQSSTELMIIIGLISMRPLILKTLVLSISKSYLLEATLF